VFLPKLNSYSCNRRARGNWKTAVKGVRFLLAWYSPAMLCLWFALLLGCSSFRAKSNVGLTSDLTPAIVPLGSLVEQGAEILWSCMFDRNDELSPLGRETQQINPSPSSFGWLVPHPNTDRISPIPYLPREGDIVITTSCCHHVRLFKLAGTGHPLHVGLLVKNENGELTFFESTVVDRGVTMFPAEERFQHFIDNHRSPLIWVRPIREPLTPEQSQKLTQFALSQQKKGFAFMRSAAFVLPVERIHKTSTKQWTWFCTELTIEGVCQAELLSTQVNPATILPEDIYHNRKIDLNGGWLPATTWAPSPAWPSDRPKGAPTRPE